MTPATKWHKGLVLVVVSAAYRLSVVKVAVHKSKVSSTSIDLIWLNKVIIDGVKQIFKATSFKNITQLLCNLMTWETLINYLQMLAHNQQAYLI